jgi:hypothetical protein
MEAKLRAFLSSAFDGNDWSAKKPRPHYPKEKNLSSIAYDAE